MNKNIFEKIFNRFKQTFLVLVGKAFTYPKDNYEFHGIFFSQAGEDILLQRIFERKSKGFYVDIGAHHPQRFSNTYLFYLKGWRGINIDAMPGSMNLFNKIRPNDINLEIPISNYLDNVTYYMFDEPALNTFDKNLAIERTSKNGRKILSNRLLKTQKLSQVLDLHLPENQDIDFMSIDVEGLDYQVLLSNDWLRFKPKIVLVEELQISLQSLPNRSEIYFFMIDKGYELFSSTYNTSFYKLIST
jgi:FkbM family methyltransferase